MFETIIIIIFPFMCVYYKQRVTISEFLLSEDFCVCVYGNTEHLLQGESFSQDK